MKSGKQRRIELRAKRHARREKATLEQEQRRRAQQERCAARGVAVNRNKLAPDGSYDIPAFVSRGYYVDQPFVCEGCGKCMEVCAFKGRKMVNGKAKVDLERCLGCGRCADVCPTGATTIEIDDMSSIDDLIAKIEDHVDVRDQSSLKQ